METGFLPLILSINEHGIIEWWVGVSFAVHEDMKIRTGMCMSLGKGTIYAASAKQRLNTVSTTESELVGVADAMPKLVWTRLFMEAQGYNVEDVYVYQDNQSAILLEVKRMKPVGKKSRHISIKYFFVTNRVKNKELNIIYCPTKQMVADLFTKPLQGVLFITHRNAVSGISQDDMPLYRNQYEAYITRRNVANAI